MKFATLDSLVQAGFEGFLPTAELRASRCERIPKVPGVYCVVRDSTEPPRFLPTSPGGHFKERDPTVPIERLESNWVAGTVVVYIGKAGGEGGSATLRSRLWSYMRFGAGEPVGHWGGRLIWQLSDHPMLRICWRASSEMEPRAEESDLLEVFESIYGALPFANLTH